MTAVNPPFAIQARADHPARLFREMLASLRGQAGVIAATDLAVTQNGTPNMSVNVAAGKAVIDGNQGGATQGSYLVYNDAIVNLTIAASDPTNPRNDLIIAQVQDAEYSGASNQWLLSVVQGTPAATPADPGIPFNSLMLARVRVNATATTIVNANITDLRSIGVITNQNASASGTLKSPGSTAATGVQSMASPLDHVHPLLSSRSSQAALGSFVLGAATWTNFGAAVVIAVPAASRLLVFGTVEGSMSLNTSFGVRVLVDGGLGESGGTGDFTTPVTGGYLTQPIFDSFIVATGNRSVQAQIQMVLAGTFVPSHSMLQLWMLVIPS